MRTTPLVLALPLALAAAADAQTPAAHTLHGIVRSTTGVPVAGASIFLLESLDGATTDSAGQFALRTSAGGVVTIVARRIGFAPARALASVDTSGPIALVLVPQAPTLVPITVQAGAYRAGNERGATLSALEVVSTPGATADVARAMQTLPGVQNVDEGTGLFVRGGDVSETKVLLNDAVMLSPYNYETPTGNNTVTVNPFLLDGILFSSGGFGARYGNVLSGIADLRTAGRPPRSSETAVAGLASVSTGVDLALAHGVSAHATAARNDTRYLFKVNGETRDYTPAPNGEDLSASVIYDYRPGGEIKTFAIDRRNAVGVSVEDPSFSGGYTADVRSRMLQAGWSDVFGSLAPTVSVSNQTARRSEGYGVFALGSDERWTQTFAQLAWSPVDRYTARLGGDLSWRDSRLAGSLPASFADPAPGARHTLFDAPIDETRSGAFGELDWRATSDLRVVSGVRTDYSSLTRTRTIDPRLSAAYRVGPATLTAAVGEYHQVPEPIYLAPGIGNPLAGPERARQLVAGAQVGEGAQVARVELYDKAYRDLVGLTRDTRAVTIGGAGRARGADVFVKHSLWPFFTARVTYSYVDTKRTDPDTRVVTRTPFDIRNSMTLIGDQALPKGWSVSVAWRYASGKPFTPVVGATRDASRPIWIPEYGASFSERLPASERFDLAASRVMRLSSSNQLVYFVSLDNVFDRTNLYQYTYTPDYSKRIPVRSLFNRSLYVGGSFTHLGARP